MNTALLAVAVAAALACPLHMLWHRRRGRSAPSAHPGAGHDGPSVRELRARQRAVAEELGAREATERQEALS